MIAVKATREGLLGAKTASGYLVEGVVPYVALPDAAALRQWVTVFNPKNGKFIRALVLDVGPWNEQDHSYVFQPATMQPQLGRVVSPEVRPSAERGTDTRGRTTNGAGIDLGEQVWHALEMTDNTDVSWEFV